jgi:hypothetical protein
MSRNRYICVAQFEGNETAFLWETGDDQPDRVVLDDAGLVVTFPSVLAAAEALGAPDPANEVTKYDLDAIQTWCTSSSEVVDCVVSLNAWNLLRDLPNGDLFTAADACTNVIYDKLFRGCNLPSMTNPGEVFVPTWQPAEIATLKHLLLLGLAELRARLPVASTR